MSYLDYSRPDDRSHQVRLRDLIKRERSMVSTEMVHARTWRSRPYSDFQQKAIANHVRRAREFNREVLKLQRKLRELEATS